MNNQMRTFRAALATFVALAALAGLLALAVHDRAADDRAAEQRADDRRVVARIEEDLDQVIYTSGQLRRTVAAVGLRRARESFAAFAQATVANPVVGSVAIEQAVATGGRRAFEREAAIPIVRPSISGAPVEPGGPSLVVTAAVSKAASASSSWGIDVLVDPTRRRTLRSAFATNAMRATPPVNAISHPGIGSTIYAPVGRRPGMPFPDVVAISLDLSKLGERLARNLPPGSWLAVVDAERTIARAGRADGAGATADYAFAGRTWRLSGAAPTPSLSATWISVLVGGVVGAALIAFVAGAALARIARVRRDREEATTRFAGLFAQSPIGIAVLDARLFPRQVNPALLELAGRQRTAIFGRPLTHLLASEHRDAVSAELARLTAEGRGGFAEEVRLRPSGERDDSWVRLTASTVTAGSGAVEVLLQVQDVTERRRAQATLEQLAECDPLTGLLNRRAFEARLDEHVHLCSRHGRAGAVLAIDLDGFKAINDSLGHAAGDELLSGIAGALRAELRASDVVGRLGGDEFAVLLYGEASAEEFEQVAAKLRAAVKATEIIGPGDAGLGVSASVGVASLREHPHADAAGLLAIADAAMYTCKRAASFPPRALTPR